MARYVHVIRHPDDPERSPRPRGGREDRAPHRTLAVVAADEFKPQILALLSDGVPRSFNRIGVELLDQTADMLLGSPVDRALWALVDAGDLELTLEAPVLFRVATSEV
jgi:hypothetical protein